MQTLKQCSSLKSQIVECKQLCTLLCNKLQRNREEMDKPTSLASPVDVMDGGVRAILTILLFISTSLCNMSMYMKYLGEDILRSVRWGTISMLIITIEIGQIPEHGLFHYTGVMMSLWGIHFKWNLPPSALFSPGSTSWISMNSPALFLRTNCGYDLFTVFTQSVTVR